MSDSKCEPILDAAGNGDMEFLKKAYDDNNGDLQSYFLGRKDTKGRNLLHVGVENKRYMFLLGALEILSSHPTLVIDLICQTEEGNGYNPLHYAAMGGNIFIVKLLVNAYDKAVDAAGGNDEVKLPWMTTSSVSKHTPLRCSMLTQSESHENVAKYLVSWELRARCQARCPVDQCTTMILDSDRTSVLFKAMQNGFSRFVEEVLGSDLPYRDNGSVGETPLHYAFKCNERVSRLLFEKHPELIGKLSFNRKTVLDKAVENGTTWLVKLMLIDKEEKGVIVPQPWIKACRRQIWHTSRTTGDTPFHVAARKGYIGILRVVTRAYRSAIHDEVTKWDGEEAKLGDIDLLGWNPLYIKNLQEDVPLVVALKYKNDDCGVLLCEDTFPIGVTLDDMDLYIKALRIAAENGCRQSVKKILERTVLYGPNNLLTKLRKMDILTPCVLKIFAHLSMSYPVRSKMFESEEMEKLLEVIPEFLTERGKDAKTHLKEAAGSRKYWLIRLLFESDKKLMMESAPAWQVACEKGYQTTLLLLIDLCDRPAFIKLCKDSKQTPLHHIRLLKYRDYQELLKHPVLEELKNEIDSDGATPLHRAIQRRDLELTKVLLETDGIDLNIKDNNGTAYDLLENHSQISKSWHEEYIKLLKLPMTEELKNQQDKNGATPLHRAIQRGDLVATKALLEIKDIKLSIKDKDGTTAFHLLENRCARYKGWGKMCREIEQRSTVKQLKYVFTKISFEGMQNTLSVVAALVATITFAAGITVPGGLPSDNIDGSPLLATKATFLVFSVSNTVAMCSSMMVLFLLLGPMMWDPHPSLLYVNSSLILLLTSLGCTMLAFMTGAYVTMMHEVKWDAVFVLVSCSFTLFVACIVLFYTYSSTFQNKVRQLRKSPEKDPETMMQADDGATSSTPPVNLPNTSQQSSGPSDIQSRADGRLSGSTNAPVTKASGNPVTPVPELGQRQPHNMNGKVGESSGTSPMATNQDKIEHVVNVH